MRCIGDGRDIWSHAVKQSAVPAAGGLGIASGPAPVLFLISCDMTS